MCTLRIILIAFICWFVEVENQGFGFHSGWCLSKTPIVLLFFICRSIGNCLLQSMDMRIQMIITHLVPMRLKSFPNQKLISTRTGMSLKAKIVMSFQNLPKKGLLIPTRCRLRTYVSSLPAVEVYVFQF